MDEVGTWYVRDEDEKLCCGEVSWVSNAETCWYFDRSIMGCSFDVLREEGETLRYVTNLQMNSLCFQ